MKKGAKSLPYNSFADAVVLHQLLTFAGEGGSTAHLTIPDPNTSSSLSPHLHEWQPLTLPRKRKTKANFNPSTIFLLVYCVHERSCWSTMCFKRWKGGARGSNSFRLSLKPLENASSWVVSAYNMPSAAGSVPNPFWSSNNTLSTISLLRGITSAAHNGNKHSSPRTITRDSNKLRRGLFHSERTV